MDKNWYVLMVRTGMEQQAKQEILKACPNEIISPFIPSKKINFKKAGEIKKETHPMFPGYIFIESALASKELSEITKNLINQSFAILKLLRYGDSDELALREEDKAFLLDIWNEDRCIELSKGIIVGDKIIINEGPFEGKESMIKKINRHKMTADVEIEIFGAIRRTIVGLEIVEKIPLA